MRARFAPCVLSARPRAATLLRTDLRLQHGHIAQFASAAHPETVDTVPKSLQYTERPFALERGFCESYRSRRAPFGFGGLGELVYYRTYARKKADGTKERWPETVERVVNGCFRLQHEWALRHGRSWDDVRAQDSAQDMFERIFAMKFLPPGRGLWAMGTPITEEKRLYAALNNCGFVSTAGAARDPAAPFCFLMDASMLGVGVGFDTRGAGAVQVREVGADVASRRNTTNTFVVPDSREGWVESVRLLLQAYLGDGTGALCPSYEFDYSEIRPAGTPIRGFGGVASGSGSLEALHDSVRQILEPLRGKALSTTAIVDIMNVIGVCVVSANVRRTAEIAFGDADDEEYIDLKNYDKNPHRADFGWTSNNSIFGRLGMDYGSMCERVRLNGEPGIAWLDNMRSWGRMQGTPDHRDARAEGGNPCLEQTLESYELCCLVETFPQAHASFDDFGETLRSAFLYAKSVTLGEVHWPRTAEIMSRNRRVGCSMSGVQQFVGARGIGELRAWCEHGYDTVQAADAAISQWMGVPRSIKTTSVKPSGTVSLLAGATPGMHWPESRYYVRRVRLSAESELVAPLRRAGVHLEPAIEDSTSLVASFPIDAGAELRTLDQDVTMWEQFSMAAFLQRHWADNQVSCTVTFDPDTEGQSLAHALSFFETQLKGISMLPKLPGGAYEQMPYEAITREQYERLTAGVTDVAFDDAYAEAEAVGGADSDAATAVPDQFCDTDACALPTAAKATSRS